MSANGLASVIEPVMDYEPPAYGGPPKLPPAVDQPYRRKLTAAAHDEPATDDRDRGRTAATFADAALRRILEVIDRRRPLAQLRPLLATGLADSLLCGRTTGAPAILRRVRAQLTGPAGTAAEVSAHYTRGQRVHAIACRVEQRPTATGPRWQVVALHLG